MNASAVIATPTPLGPIGRRLVAAWPALAVAAIGAATVAAVIVSNGHPVAAVAPVLGASLVWAACRLPLRVTLGAVMLVGLSVDRPGDADGRWTSPVVTVGGAIFHNLNHIVDVDALKFSGAAALIALLLGVRVHRGLVGRHHDTPASLRLAPVMAWALAAGALTVAVFVAYGMARGGDLQMAKVQVQAYLQLLAVAWLFGGSLRGARDLRWLGGIVVLAACIKAMLALWLRATLPAAYPDQWGVMRELEYVTNHGDSLVFTFAISLLIGPLFHAPTRRQVATALLLGGLVVAGTVANDRRIAYVQIAGVVATYLALNRTATLTQRAMRLCVVLSPLLVIYSTVGWSSGSRLFAPVAFVRNIVMPERSDGSIDRSTLFRDIENFNLVFTFIKNPVVGTGFGHPFETAVEGDRLQDFKEYSYLPHNSMIGLWAFAGAVGFTGLLLPFLVAMTLAIRAHAAARRADQAISAAVAIGAVLAYLVHLWADIGFTEAPTIFLTGMALALAGQVAVETRTAPGTGVATFGHVRGSAAGGFAGRRRLSGADA